MDSLGAQISAAVKETGGNGADSPTGFLDNGLANQRASLNSNTGFLEHGLFGGEQAMMVQESVPNYGQFITETLLGVSNE